MSISPPFAVTGAASPQPDPCGHTHAAAFWRAHPAFVDQLLAHTGPVLAVHLGPLGGTAGALLGEAMARCAAAAQYCARDLRWGDSSQAVADFADGAIGLLHIDATDPAQLAGFVFARWQPKLSPQAVVLVSGIGSSRRLRRVWGRLRRRHPSFEFAQGPGLGVLCLDTALPAALGQLYQRHSVAAAAPATYITTAEDHAALQLRHRELQQQLRALLRGVERLQAHAADVTARRETAEELLEARRRASIENEAELARRDTLLAALRLRTEAQAAQLAVVEASVGWQLVRHYWELRTRLFPAGTWRGAFYERRRDQLLRAARKRLRRWRAHDMPAVPGVAVSSAPAAPGPSRYWDAPLTAASRQSQGARILIVAELSIPACRRYRVDQKVDMFRHLGLETSVISWHDAAACHAALPFHGIVIFYRVPATPDMLLLAAEARRFAIPSFFDVDDLIFHADAYRRQLLASGFPGERMAAMMEGTSRYRQMLSHCQHGIGSTAAIARCMDEVVPGRTHVVENALDATILDLAADIDQRPPKADERFVTIGYGSGSKTHDGDFGVVAAALLAVLQRHPQVRLAIHGPLALPARFERFADRVFQIPFLGGEDYLRALASWQINIAPLEDSLFNEAKSNIKFIEAAILGVPSVCSGTAPFRGAIEHGRTGMIADTPAQWGAALTRLVTDAGLRRRMAHDARQAVMARYHPHAVAAAQLHGAVAPLLPAPTSRLKVLTVNVLFAPVSFGGATVVAEQLCRRLQADGCDVTVFTAVLESDLAAYSVVRYEVDGLPVVAVQVAPGTERALDYEDPQVGRIFAQLLASLRPDVVHFHSIQRLGAAMAHACMEAGVPYAITLHDAWWLCERQFMVQEDGRYCGQASIDLRACSKCVPDSGFTFRRRFFLDDVLDKASLLLAPSDFQRGLYLSNGIAPERIVVNRNGVQLPARARAPRRRGSPLRMAYLGGRAVHKGYFWLKQILQGMPGHAYELTLVDIALRTGASSIDAGEWNVSGRVRVVPPFEQADMDDFYDGMDVLLMPSLWKESFGLVVREALARGIWVIATASGGASEDIVEGVNGCVVGIADTAGFRRALEAAMARPDHLPNTGHAARTPRIRGYAEQASELKAHLQRIALPASSRVVDTTRRAWTMVGDAAPAVSRGAPA